jgi:hypothetical protein
VDEGSRRKRRWLVLALAAAALLIVGTGGVIARLGIFASHAGPYEVTVVHAETGEPITDAFVLATTWYEPAYGLAPKTFRGPWGVVRVDRRGKAVLPDRIAEQQALLLLAWAPGSTPDIQGWDESSASGRVVDAFQELVTTRATRMPMALCDQGEPAWPVTLRVYPELADVIHVARRRVEFVQHRLSSCPRNLISTDSSTLESFQSALERRWQACVARIPPKGTAIRHYERPRGPVRIGIIDSCSRRPLAGALVRVQCFTPISRADGDDWASGPGAVLLTDARGQATIPAELNRYGSVNILVWAPGHVARGVARFNEKWGSIENVWVFDDVVWTVRTPSELEARLPGLNRDSKPEEIDKIRQAATGIRGSVRSWRKSIERGEATEHEASRLNDPEVDRLIQRGEESIREGSSARP